MVEILSGERLGAHGKSACNKITYAAEGFFFQISLFLEHVAAEAAPCVSDVMEALSKVFLVFYMRKTKNKKDFMAAKAGSLSDFATENRR